MVSQEALQSHAGRTPLCLDKDDQAQRLNGTMIRIKKTIWKLDLSFAISVLNVVLPNKAWRAKPA